MSLEGNQCDDRNTFLPFFVIPLVSPAIFHHQVISPRSYLLCWRGNSSPAQGSCYLGGFLCVLGK